MSRWRKAAIGAGLVALFWVLFAFIAFVPFSRDTPAALILPITGAIFVLCLVLLRRRRLVDLETGLYALLSFAVLVALYAIPLQDDLPAEARQLNRRLSAGHDDRYAYAREVFWQVESLFTGPTREYLLQPQKIFLIKSAGYFWEVRGYAPSHLQAQIYRQLLLDSGRFGGEEVSYETGRCFNSPHGYVVIAHPERPIYADLWAAEALDEYRFGQLVEMPDCDTLSVSGPQGEPFPRPEEEGGSNRR